MNKHAYTPDGYKKALAANNERCKRKYETITVRVYADELNKVKLAARMRGMSVSAYINALIAADFYGFIPLGKRHTKSTDSGTHGQDVLTAYRKTCKKNKAAH